MSRASLLILFLLPQVLTAEKAVAVVMYASGERAHIQGGQSVDLEPQDLIRPGDEIETGADGRVNLQCSTGIIFQIGPSSHIKVSDLVSDPGQDSIFIRLELGTLSSVVSRGSGAQNMEIRTPTAVANVRGTEFIIEAEEEETNVMVQEGEVEVEDSSGVKARARAGRFVRTHRREKLLENALDDVKRRRLSVLAEVRERRDAKFKERVARLRASKERIKKRRDRIKNIREQRRDARENIRDKVDRRKDRLDRANRPDRRPR